MNSVELVLSDSQKEFVDAEVARGGFASANEYMLRLLQEAQRREAWQKTENLVLDGLQSGTALEVNAAYWEGKKQKLLHKYPDAGQP